MLIALGGIAAEAIHTGAYAWDEAERDLQYVRDLAERRAGRRQIERLERRLLGKAEHLLAKASHWQAVEWIVAEWLKCGEISGRTARHLYELCNSEAVGRQPPIPKFFTGGGGCFQPYAIFSKSPNLCH